MSTTYRWFFGEAGHLLDPCAGGSVRVALCSNTGTINQSALLRGEAGIVQLGMRLLPRWRRNVRYVFAPGYLTRLNALHHHRPILFKA